VKKVKQGNTVILIMTKSEDNALGELLNDWEEMCDAHGKGDEQRKIWRSLLSFIKKYFEEG
jgi:hypothetical protein